MRVTNQNLSGAAAAGTSNAQDVQKSGNGSASSATAGADGDTVELSSTLGSLTRAMQSFGSSRESMVQSLATQYQSGTYQIDSAAISRGIISEALSG
jgi:anti-sigma28 factor (negative regulator of flagellin synthesis)